MRRIDETDAETDDESDDVTDDRKQAGEESGLTCEDRALQC